MANRPSQRRSLLEVLTGRSSRKQEDGEWKVGGRYEVTQGAQLFDNAKLTGTGIYAVKPKDMILLLKHQISSGQIVGFVLPPGERRVAGWMALQNVLQIRQEGSWEMRARYRARHPATVRSDVSISSDWVCEIAPGQEVVVLEIGVHSEPDDPTQTRLRLKVSAEKGDLVGWLSPLTSAGDMLLDPVNLLGMDAVKIHRASVMNNDTLRASSMKRLSRASQDGTLSRESGKPMNVIPWEVGGKYRVLEKSPLREKADLNSKKLGTIPVGAFVTISEIHMMECAYLGWCPVAYVQVTSGTTKLKMKHRRGWIRCAGKDARDLVCTRDQLEFEKVNAKLRAAPVAHPGHAGAAEKKVQISPHPPQQREVSPNRPADDYEDDYDDYSDEGDWDEEDWESEDDHEADEVEEGHSNHEEEPPEKALDPAMVEPKLPAGVEKQVAADDQKAKEREFVKKLQAMEIGVKEEKMVDDKTVVTDEKTFCGCDCGAKTK